VAFKHAVVSVESEYLTVAATSVRSLGSKFCGCKSPKVSKGCGLQFEGTEPSRQRYFIQFSRTLQTYSLLKIPYVIDTIKK